MITARLLAPLAAVALFAAGCGSDNKDTNSASTGTNAATTPAATTTQAQATTGQAPAVSNAADLKSKPKIATPGGDPPTELIKKDLVVGTGPAIKKGQLATMQYVGVSWSTGAEFDASWDRGQPFQFPLGQGQVITGWDDGIPGMKVGGRRELVIPPDQAYGPQSPGPGIGPNETLVFVVDLKRIG
ncbi:MAG: peptidylprolyl isomerase FKBP-type [Solirubrobacterales bacterium]|jgi:peptidylprolyl isomerase|nr:peptidylprolyl isomerase FKBP-type [Solirubrobacterales bacterium]